MDMDTCRLHCCPYNRDWVYPFTVKATDRPITRYTGDRGRETSKRDTD